MYGRALSSIYVDKFKALAWFNLSEFELEIIKFNMCTDNHEQAETIPDASPELGLQCIFHPA